MYSLLPPTFHCLNCYYSGCKWWISISSISFTSIDILLPNAKLKIFLLMYYNQLLSLFHCDEDPLAYSVWKALACFLRMKVFLSIHLPAVWHKGQCLMHSCTPSPLRPSGNPQGMLSAPSASSHQMAVATWKISVTFPLCPKHSPLSSGVDLPHLWFKQALKSSLTCLSSVKYQEHGHLTPLVPVKH